jgi:hypothetical protein
MKRMLVKKLRGKVKDAEKEEKEEKGEEVEERRDGGCESRESLIECMCLCLLVCLCFD